MKEQQRKQQNIQQSQHQTPLLVHLDHLGPTITFNRHKSKEEEPDLLTDEIGREYKHRRVNTKEQIK